MSETRWLVLLLIAACASARAATPHAADPLDAALEKRIAGKAPLDDVSIFASWQRAEGSTSVKAWGTGVGVWQHRTQFSLSRGQVISLLKILASAKVGAMVPPGTPGDDDGDSPLRVLGELSVTAGSESKSLYQLTKGEQSESLRQVVLAILDFCEKPARTGVTLASMPEGLQKLAAGTLAPETFDATVQRREDPKGPNAGESWLLRIDGLHVTDRLMPKGQAPPAPKALGLPRADFLRLARVIADNDPVSLPRNVYASAYTDMRIEVLGEERIIPARAYLDVTHETHGEKQLAFDRLYEVFRALHERVQKDGKAVAAPKSGRYAERDRRAGKPAPTSSPAKR